MKHLLKLLVVILFTLAASPVPAQFAAPGGLPPGFPHALLDVLGTRPSFSGTAQIEIPLPGKGSEILGCQIAVASGALRLEVNSFAPGTNMSPQDASQIRQMRSITLARPDQNRLYLILPKFKSYVEVTYSQSDMKAATAPAQITKTAGGQETIDGHLCLLTNWKIIEADGEQYDLTVWTAKDVDNFPIQIRMNPSAAVFKFTDLNQAEPNPTLLELPRGYMKYEGVSDVILKTTNSVVGGTNTVP